MKKTIENFLFGTKMGEALLNTALGLILIYAILVGLQYLSAVM